MAKRWFSSSFVLAFLLSLSSCLDLNVDVAFRTSSSGQISVDALQWRSAQGLSFTSGDDRIDFPSSREAWQNIVAQVPGASLVSWSATDEDRGWHSQTVLGFSTARALEGLFVSFKQKVTLLDDVQGKWTLTFQPQVPRLTGGDPTARTLWTDLWGKQAWQFRFAPPGKAPVVRQVLLADLAQGQAPAEWTLTW